MIAYSVIMKGQSVSGSGTTRRSCTFARDIRTVRKLHKKLTLGFIPSTSGIRIDFPQLPQFGEGLLSPRTKHTASCPQKEQTYINWEMSSTSNTYRRSVTILNNTLPQDS